jgi:hypothetical protein
MEQSKAISTARSPAWRNAAILLAASWIAMAALSMRVGPQAGIVAVVFPPWWSAQRTFAAAASADAAIVRETMFHSLLVVRPNDDNGLARLRQAGAWLAIDPQAIAACLSKSN